MTFNPIRTRNAIDALIPDGETTTLTFGTITAINADGSVQALVGTQPTRATPLGEMAVGDRVGIAYAQGVCFAWKKGNVDVLYDDADGAASVTLSESAENYSHMRIYFKKNGDSYAHGSVDVYEPNGKNVALLVINPYDSTHTQFAGRAVSISGASISGLYREGYMNTTWQTTETPSVYITRVEAWN